MTLATGQVLENRYRIISMLAQGGMGAVYRAWDLNLRIPVALKENLDLSGSSQEQFEREALLLAPLSHPNLPRVTNHFMVSGQGQYLVMEFIDGEDLQERLNKRGPLAEAEAVPIISEIASALSYLHSRPEPVIHRDIKPANIKITSDNRAILVDFGIAKQFRAEGQTTRRGAQAVTPGFSPPEQYGLGSTDSRSDVYAVGATLYALLTGEKPLESVSRLAGATLPPLPPTFSPHVAQSISRAMEMEPRNRFQSVEAFSVALTTPATKPSVSATSGYPVTILLYIESVIFLLIALISLMRLLRQGGIESPDAVTRLASSLVVAVFGFIFLGAAIRTGLRQPRMLRPHIPQAKPHEKPKVGIEHPTSGSGPLGSTDRGAMSEREGDEEGPSGTQRLKFPELVAIRQGYVLDNLILSDSLSRLNSFISHSKGGRFVLTGYGRFGGTSLVRGAMRQAQQYLAANGEKSGGLLCFYFTVDENGREFQVKANEYSVGIFSTETQAGTSNLGTLRKINITTPLDIGFFHRSNTRDFSDVTSSSPYSLNKFVSEFVDSQNQGKGRNDLQRMVLKLIGQKNLPTRVVFVMDKIGHLETLEQLSDYHLFQSDQLSVIAIARKENFDAWKNAQHRLKTLGFQQWYIPSTWGERSQLRIKLRDALFAINESANANTDNEILEDVLKHFEFIGRGVLGDTLDHLKHPQNWLVKKDATLFAFSTLWQQAYVQRNCWLQDLLEKNWSFILGDLLFDSPEVHDRARIGSYELVAWMVGEMAFSPQALLSAASTRTIKISSTETVREATVQNLVYVLERNRFLKRETDGNFRVKWRPDSRPTFQVYRRSPKWKLDSRYTGTNKEVHTLDNSPPSQLPSEGAIIGVLTERFSKSDLDDLAIQLGIDPEDVKGDNKAARARELTVYLKHRDRLSELVDAIRKMRPGKL